MAQLRSGLSVTLAALLLGPSAQAQGAGFEQIAYQGRLELDGRAEDGRFDFRFEIVAADGQVQWTDSFTGVEVHGGRFAVSLGSGVPFPAGLWQAPDLFLQIQVRPSGPGAYTALAGRQPLHAVPVARRASEARDYHVSGNLVVDQAAQVGGDLEVTGTLHSGAQQVLGSQLVTGDQQVHGGLQVGGPVNLAATASVQGDLSVGGALKLRGLHEQVSQAGGVASVTRSHWDIQPTRYRLSIDKSFANLSHPVPHEVLLAYCADPDGCTVKIGMTGWGADTTVLTVVTLNLSYDAGNGHYRFERNVPTDGYVEAIDGDHGETNLSCPYAACCLIDYNYAAGAQDDDAQGLWLHWSLSGWNTPTKRCVLILED